MAGPPPDVQMLVLDVDGVLTDNTVFVGSDGTDFKRFCIADGLGIKLLMQAGVRVAIISGHASESTVRRFRSLGIEDVAVGVTEKRPVFEELLKRHDVAAARTAAVGDDLLDLPILRAAGWAATVPAAPPVVRDASDYVTSRAGGDGAVREIAELLLHASGRWTDVMRSFGQV